MPPGSSAYRSFVTCNDPEGVVDCGTVRKSRFPNMENSFEKHKIHKSSKLSRLRDGDENSRNSASQLEEIEKGAEKLNQMIESWSSGMSIDGQSKDIARDLLRGALDLQESLNMLSKLQEASLQMAKLKRLETHSCGNVQKGRVSVVGSTRSKCVENQIQDRPNLLTVTCVDSQWDKRGISWGSEVQSTSSSQSSVYFSKKACSTDNSSVSSDTSDKRPNLIAKLMGLEKIKPAQAKAATSIELQNEKNYAAFDIQVPEARRPNLLRYQEKRMLRDSLEAAQSKANLENKFAERLIIPVLHLLPRTHRADQSRVDVNKFPPIVIMKPMNNSYKELENSHELHVENQERELNGSVFVKELEGKHWFSPVQHQVSERASPVWSEKNSKAPRLSQEKRKLPKGPVAKLQSNETKRKEMAVVSMERTSRADKTLRIIKSPDVSNGTKKYAKEKNLSGTKLMVTKAAVVSPSKPRNPNKNSSNIRSLTSRQIKVSQPIISKYSKEAGRHYPTGVKKTQKRKKELGTKTLMNDKLRHEDDVSAVDLSCQVSVETHTHTAPLLMNTKILTEAEIEDNLRDVEMVHHISCEERSYNYHCRVDCEVVSSNTSCLLKSRSVQENILLSSPSFIDLVELLFDLDLSASKVVKRSLNVEADTTLFISYAKEVVERRSKQLPYVGTSTGIPESLHQLVDEICDGYETIANYKDDTHTDEIFDMLARDIKCKEVVSSVWDLGWKDRYSTGEIQEMAAILEELILLDFIDEIFVK